MKSSKSDITNIECEDCGVGLLDVLNIDPTADVDFSFIVHCGYCGGQSKKHNFHGLLQQDGTSMSDVISIDINEDEGIVHFYTQKVTRVK